MSAPRGYAVWIEGDGKTSRETDSFACVHCNKQVFTHGADGAKREQNTLGSFCTRCSGPTCANPKCNAANGCTPFEQKLADYERSTIARRQLFEALGR